jgi:hypothetical protein
MSKMTSKIRFKCDFVEGKVVAEAGANRWEVSFADASEQAKKAAFAGGIRQRLRQAWNGNESDALGKIELDNAITLLSEGKWNSRSSSGGIWAEVFFRFLRKIDPDGTKWDDDQIGDMFSALIEDEDKMKKFRTDKGVKMIKAQVELERAQSRAGAGGGFSLEGLGL